MEKVMLGKKHLYPMPFLGCKGNKGMCALPLQSTLYPRVFKCLTSKGPGRTVDLTIVRDKSGPSLPPKSATRSSPASCQDGRQGLGDALFQT